MALRTLAPKPVDDTELGGDVKVINVEVGTQFVHPDTEEMLTVTDQHHVKIGNTLFVSPSVFDLLKSRVKTR